MKHFVVVDTSGIISVCKGKTIAEAVQLTVGIDYYKEVDHSTRLGFGMWCGRMQMVNLEYTVLNDGTYVPAKVYPNLQSLQSFIGKQFASKEEMMTLLQAAM